MNAPTPQSIYEDAQRTLAEALVAYQHAFEEALRTNQEPPPLAIEYPEVALARTGVSVDEGMRIVLASTEPEERELLLKACAKDTSILQLLQAAHAEDREAQALDTIYVGLVEVQRGEWIHCDAHFGPRYAESLALAALFMADRERGIELCPTYACLALVNAIRQADRKQLLGPHERRTVRVGWDNGDFRELGSFSASGWEWAQRP